MEQRGQTSPPKISITAGGAERLGKVAPLWAELREHHAGLSPLWRDSILRSQFESRMDQLRAKCAPGRILVLLATTAGGGENVGYCVRTLSPDGTGEVDLMAQNDAARRLYESAGFRARTVTLQQVDRRHAQTPQ